MGFIQHLAEAAAIAARRIGSLDLIASEDVDAFLRAAKSQGTGILGIDGFRIDGNSALSDVNTIADFSGLSHGSDTAATTIEEARRFLLQVSKPAMFFDFTIND